MSYGSHSYASTSFGGSTSFRGKIIKAGKVILRTLGVISVLQNKESKLTLSTKTEK